MLYFQLSHVLTTSTGITEVFRVSNVNVSQCVVTEVKAQYFAIIRKKGFLGDLCQTIIFVLTVAFNSSSYSDTAWKINPDYVSYPALLMITWPVVSNKKIWFAFKTESLKIVLNHSFSLSLHLPFPCIALVLPKYKNANNPHCQHFLTNLFSTSE